MEPVGVRLWDEFPQRDLSVMAGRSPGHLRFDGRGWMAGIRSAMTGRQRTWRQTLLHSPPYRDSYGAQPLMKGETARPTAAPSIDLTSEPAMNGTTPSTSACDAPMKVASQAAPIARITP